jgi:hypothetical protein
MNTDFLALYLREFVKSVYKTNEPSPLKTFALQLRTIPYIVL